MDDNAETQGLVEILNIMLATNYALQLKTQNYHWNVTGPSFGSLHLMFENQYNDLASASDAIAERIRAIGEKVPASFTHFLKNKRIEEGSHILMWQEMVNQLSKDHKIMSDICRDGIIEAEKLHDEATSNILEERMERHEKYSWMLKSHLT